MIAVAVRLDLKLPRNQLRAVDDPFFNHDKDIHLATQQRGQKQMTFLLPLLERIFGIQPL